MAQTDVAWKQRSAATRQNLTEDQMSDFMSHLDMADKHLASVMELDPRTAGEPSPQRKNPPQGGSDKA
jgi:hypothetical protein